MANPFEEPKFEKPAKPKEETEKSSLVEKEPEKTERPPEVLREEIKKEREKEKDFLSEIQERAEEFDKELVEIIGKQLKTGELTSEQANEILERTKELNPEQKAEVLEELDREKEMSPEEREEKEKANKEFQEAVFQYEKAIDDLAEKARALGIEISAEQLRAYLENLAQIEPEPEEKMEWFEELNENIKNLSQQLDKLEKSKAKGEFGPEEEKEIKKDVSKIFENLTAKLIEYTIKLTVRIAKGIIKGTIRAFRKTSENATKPPHLEGSPK